MLTSIFGSKGAFKSLTFWGVFGAIAGTLAQNFDPSVLPGNVEGGLQVLGSVLTVLGLRKSNTKAVAEVAKLVEDLAAQRPREH